MLCENIKAIRKSKGLSQEELAIKLNVVRQTISKWEQGLSVPDADMLISLSEAFETPVSTLLGEPVTAAKADDLKAVSEKLEIINLQLAQGKPPALTQKSGRLPIVPSYPVENGMDYLWHGCFGADTSVLETSDQFFAGGFLIWPPAPPNSGYLGHSRDVPGHECLAHLAFRSH